MKKKLLWMLLSVMHCANLLYAMPDGSVSIMSRVYGNYYSPEVLQSPAQGALGTLNIGFGVDGSLDMSAQVTSSQAQAMRILSNGTMVVALDNGGSTEIAFYTTSGISLATYSLPYSVTLPHCMQLDSQENIVVGGGERNGHVGGWLQRLSSTGVNDSAFMNNFDATTGTWNFIGNVAEQSTGNLIVVGLKNGYTQVARLLPSGALDTTFGTHGYIIFNGSNSGHALLPTSTSGAYSVVITVDDSIFVGYCDATTTHAAVVKFVVNGQMATGFGDSGIVLNAVGAINVVPNQICTALDWNGNLIVGATTIEDDDSNSIGLIAYNANNGTYVGDIVPMNIPSSDDSDSIQLSAILTLTNGSLAVLSSDITSISMRVDQFNSDGTVDATFNADTTPGFFEFYAAAGSGTVTESVARGAAIAPNGQLFVAGYQVTTGPDTTVPYLFEIYDYSYVVQVPQYATSVQQGLLDVNFGGSSSLTYPGIVNPYCGKYRGNLQQHPTAIVVNFTTPPTGGDLIVGMYGSTNTSSTVSMMLNWLTPSGVLDDFVGSSDSGQLILENQSSGNHEFLYAMAQGRSGALYVTGNANTQGAIVRQYTNSSTSGWATGTDAWHNVDTVTASTSKGVGVALQGGDLVIMFEDCDGTTGAISAFSPSTGALANGVSGAPIFGDGGSGVIQTDSYGLSMGPVYAGVINDFGNIFVAYIDSGSHAVTIAAFNKTGSALIPTFGTAGVVANIFNLVDPVSDVTSVRLSFNAYGDLVVCTVDPTNSYILLAQVSQVNGVVDRNFGDSGVASIPLTNPTVTQLQGINDSSMVLTGSVDGNQMYIARVTKSGTLDTTFNAQGSQPGVAIIAAEMNPYQAIATGVAVQTSLAYKGDLVVIGSQDLYSTDASPMVANIFGAPGTRAVKNYPDIDQDLGTLDQSLNGSGGLNLSTLISAGTAQVMYAYPEGNVYEGMILIGVDTGASTNIARVDTANFLLDPNFNATGTTPGIYTTSELAGISALAVDKDNRIIFAGIDQYIVVRAQRLTVDGDFDCDFAIPDSPRLISITAMAQQKSGRYILACNFDDIPSSVIAFQDELVGSNTSLQIDTTFNPMNVIPGIFGVAHGYYIYSMVINADDTILAAWVGDVFYVSKVLANGSGLLNSFGTYDDGIATTGILPSDNSTIRIALDASENIIAAASTSADDMQVIRLLPTGFVDNTWNPLAGVGQITTVNGCGHSVKLTSLLESTTQQTILLGYNTVRRINGIHGPMFAVSLDATGILDTTWNPNAIYADVPGILTYRIEDSTIMGTGAFAINGNVYTVGGNGTDPLLMEIVASGILATQDPLAINPGIIDPTINTQGTDDDALNLNTQLSLTLGTPKQLHIMDHSNGAMIMGSMIDTTAYITKLNADLSLDITFNAAGTSPSAPGMIALTGIETLRDLFVADEPGDNGNIYLTGQTAGGSPVMWAEKIAANGFFKTSLTATNTLTLGTAIRQGNNNILIAGYNGTSGVIFGCTSDMTQLDTSFGNGTPGYYITGIDSPIVAMAVDNQYRIYIAYFVDEILYIQRLLANGSGVDPDFGTDAIDLTTSTQQVQLALDQEHNHLVVAVQNQTNPGNHIVVKRINTINGGTLGVSTDISIAGEVLELSSLFIDTDQKIYVVGYNSVSPYQTVVARLKPLGLRFLALDASYAADGGTPGIANVAVTPINVSGFSIGAAILHPDRRVYVVGADTDNIPYMARFFGDNYATEVSQAILAASPGDFDVTYGDGLGYAITFADSASYDTTQNQQVKSIAHLNSTKLMTVIDDGINSWTVRLLQNGTNDPSYGTPGGQGALIAKLSGDEVVTAMIVSGTGEYFVIGNNSSTGTGYLKKITATGAMDQLFGGNTGSTSTASYPAGTMYGFMSDPRALVELTNGNIVIAGNNLGVGTIQMVGPTGVISTTFGGSGQVVNGINIPSISADASNNLYVAVGYDLGGSKAIRVMKLDQTGSLVTSFGADGSADAVLVGIADYNNIQLALDRDDKILVAGTSATTAGIFAVVQLESDGTISPGFNYGHQLNIALPHAATAVVNLANIVTLQDRKILIAGYQQDDATDENNTDFVACITDSGVLDATFNQYELQGSIPGIAVFQAGSAPEHNRSLYRMDVQANGQIVLAGSQLPVIHQSVPYTMRLIGYANDQAIQQYPGDVPVTPSVLNPAFNEIGIATTQNTIDSFIKAGGPVALDSAGNIIIVGVTSDTFNIARFLSNGEFDTSFGTDGIGTSSAITNLVAGCSIVIDSFDSIYVGGITTDNQFVVVKFDDMGNLVTGYGTGGVSLTNPNHGISLFSGGYVTLSTTNEIIIAGYSSTGQFAINRLHTSGSLVETYVSQLIPYLMSGGFIASDSSHNFYLGGATSVGTLVAVKFVQSGDSFVQDMTFNEDSGVAVATIVDLVAGGTIAIDSHDNIVIGGYTQDETLAVARCTSLGVLDPVFNATGIAYSQPIVSLLDVGSVAIGSLNDVIIGGFARNYVGIKNMVVAVFTTDGLANTQFSSTGTGSTELIAPRSIPFSVTDGGFVVVNSVGQIVVGGIQNPSVMNPVSRLVVAEMYSGYEILIDDLTGLSPEDLKTYYYGNDIDYLNAALALEYFANVISDSIVREIVIDAIKINILEFAAVYENTPGFNLTWHLYLDIPSLQALQVALVDAYGDSAAEIAMVFVDLIERIINLKIAS